MKEMPWALPLKILPGRIISNLESPTIGQSQEEAWRCLAHQFSSYPVDFCMGL